MACGSTSEVAENADIAFLMLLETPEVAAVLFDENKVASGLGQGKAVVDMSLISPIKSKVFAEETTLAVATT